MENEPTRFTKGSLVIVNTGGLDYSGSVKAVNARLGVKVRFDNDTAQWLPKRYVFAAVVVNGKRVRASK